MNCPNSLRQTVAVTLVVLLGCCSCSATPPTAAPATAPLPGVATPTRSNLWPPVRTEPPGCTLHPANQVLGMGRVEDIAVSPSGAVSADGETLAVAGSVGIVFYRMDTFEWVRTLGEPGERATSVAFSPDGATLASGMVDGPVLLWDVATGARGRVLDGHAYKIEDLVFSPDGAMLASVATGGPVLLWDVATGEQVRALAGEGFSLAFSPDGATVAVGSAVDNASLWDVETGEQVRVFGEHIRAVLSLAFSPDGATLVTGLASGEVVLWDVATGAFVRTLDAPRSVWAGAEGHSNLAFSPDETTLAVGSRDGAVGLWDATSGGWLGSLQAGSADVAGVAFSPDCGRLVTALSDGRVALWDAATGEQVRVLGGHSGPVIDLVFSPDGATLVSGMGNNTTWTVNQDIVLAHGSDPATVIVWDAATGRQLDLLKDASSLAIRTAVSPDGGALAFGTVDGAIHLWNVAAGKQLHTLKGHTGAVYGVAFAPDGRTLASGSADGTVVLWDVAAGRALRTLGGHNSWVTSVAFSPDGKTLAAGTSERALVLWNVKRGKRRRTLEMPAKHVSRVAFSPDGEILAAALLRGHVVLWDPSTGTRQIDLWSTRAVGDIAFSSDGKMLAVGGHGRVYLWDVAAEKQVHELVGHAGTTYRSVAFSPDGATLAAGARDGSVALWRLAPSTAFCHAWLKMSRFADTPAPISQASPSSVSPTRPPSTALPTRAGADTPDARDFGSLIYTLRADRDAIWLLAGDQPPRQLAEGELPRLSPDGCSLLYIRHTYSNPYGSEYVVLDVPMTAQRLVFSSYELWDTGVYDIVWSPDSIHLALTLGGTAKRYYSGNLWLIDTSDGTTTRVTSSGAGEPLYSPDGRWIATSTPEIGWSHGSVGLWGAEGQGGQSLFDPIWSHSKMWAGDSSGFSVALTLHGEEVSELWWVPVDADPVQLGYLPVEGVVWQPGGRRLLYDAGSLHLANGDGSEDVVVPRSEGMRIGSSWEVGGLNTGPWSSDGRWLLTHDGAGNNYLVDTERLDDPLRLSVERVHGWLDATHYLASTHSLGRTALYHCVLPETCRLVAQIGGEIARLSYTDQRCARAHEIPVLPSPTPEKDAVPALIETMLHDPDFETRSRAAWRLGIIGPIEGVVPALAQAMQEDPTMRWVVCESLFKMGPAAMEAVPALIEALEDECRAKYEDACGVERNALTRTLREITGQDFGQDAAAWRAWWAAQQ